MNNKKLFIIITLIGIIGLTLIQGVYAELKGPKADGIACPAVVR